MMETRTTKYLSSSFAMSEQELRSLVRTCQEQMEKEPGANGYETRFQVWLKDGFVTHTLTIDEITSLENIGAKEITKLTLECRQRKLDSERSIEIAFSKDTGLHPITWTIVGRSRDWAFVA